jgi:hypothetical protein
VWAADFPELLDLLAEILRDPSFPEEEVAREQGLMLQAIRAQQERPFSLAFEQVQQALYGDHPYALPGVGTAGDGGIPDPRGFGSLSRGLLSSQWNGDGGDRPQSRRSRWLPRWKRLWETGLFPAPLQRIGMFPCPL